MEPPVAIYSSESCSESPLRHDDVIPRWLDEHWVW